MATITKLKKPVIELVKVDELSKDDLAHLINKYETDKNEFVICDRGLEKIIINKNHEQAAELKKLTKKLMNCRLLDQKAEKLLDSFKALAGEKTMDTARDIWSKRYKPEISMITD